MNHEQYGWRSLFSPPARALMYKEAHVVVERPAFCVAQTLFLVYLFVTMVWSAYSVADTGDSERMAGVATDMLRALAAMSFVALVPVFPMLAAGTLDRERDSGMVEVLLTLPLPPRLALVSLISSRLFMGLLFVVVMLPVMTLPLLLGGTAALGTLVCAVIAATVAALVATLHAVTLSARGHGLGYIWLRICMVLLFPAGTFSVGHAIALPFAFLPLFAALWTVHPWIALQVGGGLALPCPAMFLALADGPRGYGGVLVGFAIWAIFMMRRSSRELRDSLRRWVAE